LYLSILLPSPHLGTARHCSQLALMNICHRHYEASVGFQERASPLLIISQRSTLDRYLE
jgi:hypothetical protein